jgi:catecholate siderophore receptor
MPPGIRLSLPAQSTVNKIDTIALYGFDTLKFNEQWLLNRPARGPLQARLPALPAAVRQRLPGLRPERSDTLFNYQLGLVYKPAPMAASTPISAPLRARWAALGNGSEDLTTTTAMQPT